jgi:ATP-dependent DNA ligase
VGSTDRPPKWIKPQLTRLVEEAPQGDGWLHEIKLDEGKDIRLLTRTGLDWSQRYRRTIDALRELKVRSAYLDGELCALNADGVPVFSRLQASMDEGRTDQLVFFVFDLLFLNGQSTAQLPLIERKESSHACSRRRSAVCAIANTSQAMGRASASMPAA